MQPIRSVVFLLCLASPAVAAERLLVASREGGVVSVRADGRIAQRWRGSVLGEYVTTYGDDTLLYLAGEAKLELRRVTLARDTLSAPETIVAVEPYGCGDAQATFVHSFRLAGDVVIDKIDRIDGPLTTTSCVQAEKKTVASKPVRVVRAPAATATIAKVWAHPEPKEPWTIEDGTTSPDGRYALATDETDDSDPFYRPMRLYDAKTGKLHKTPLRAVYSRHGDWHFLNGKWLYAIGMDLIIPSPTGVRAIRLPGVVVNRGQ